MNIDVTADDNGSNLRVVPSPATHAVTHTCRPNGLLMVHVEFLVLNCYVCDDYASQLFSLQ